MENVAITFRREKRTKETGCTSDTINVRLALRILGIIARYDVRIYLNIPI